MNIVANAKTPTTSIPHSITDDVHIGDWFWVTGRWNWDVKEDTEELLCVTNIGSNYVGFECAYGSFTRSCRVHFDNFYEECRPEPHWKDIVHKRIQDLQQQIQDHIQSLIQQSESAGYTQKQIQDGEASMLPTVCHADLSQYKHNLLALQENAPKIEKSVKELSEAIACQHRNLFLPDLARLNQLKDKISDIDERIFFVELYAGVREQVVQLREGKPAPDTDKICIRQQLLFMDEETLFDYDKGGIECESIGEFDEWVARPENVSRIMPESRCIVAFQVRRHRKDYGDSLHWYIKACKEWNDKNTYLLLRNGENIYRIISEADFSPRLFPMQNEIGEAQFKDVKTDYRWNNKSKTHDRIETVEHITPESTKFDDHFDKMMQLLRHYQRIVFVVQGLLDRSIVFHPHPKINLYKQSDFDNYITLIRDEENCIPNSTMTLEEYQKQLNSCLKKGNFVAVANQYRHGEWSKYGNDVYVNFNGKGHTVKRPRLRSWKAVSMPSVVEVDRVAKDRSYVIVSWPQEYEVWHRWHGESTLKYRSREKVPTTFVLNASAYTPGDFRMFLCDHALKGQYLSWASLLLPCEEWYTEKRKNKVKSK
jgi:hypothetical protein